jgi:hypothetical protein
MLITSLACVRVPLANGGSLVIEQTEALVSIDVNGGHGVFGHGTSQEKAILDVNLAAAKQVRSLLSSYHHFVCMGDLVHNPSLYFLLPKEYINLLLLFSFSSIQS